MTLRRVRLAALFMTIIVLLAACGGGSTSTPAPDTTATAPAAAADPATATPTPTATAEATPTETAEPSPTASPVSSGSGDFAYGFNAFMWGDDQGAEPNDKTIEMIKGAGFDWVRFPILWDEIERAKDEWHPLPLDRIVDQLHSQGIKILATVSKPPEWALDPTGESYLKNYADWEGFTHFLAERYKGKIQAYEIWNEQNLASTFGGRVSLDDYCRLLEGGYNGIKKADPDALVVFGGLTPTGVNDPTIAENDLNYLQDFYYYNRGYYTQFFDVLGVHSNATNHPPHKMYPDDPGTGAWADDPSFYFRRAEQLRMVMDEHGDDRPVWITEFGWTTANLAEGYEYGADVSEQDQADYLVEAFEWVDQHWPWVTGMFVWNLNYSVVTTPDDEKYPWSVLEEDWTPRPAYEALQTMPKR